MTALRRAAVLGLVAAVLYAAALAVVFSRADVPELTLGSVALLVVAAAAQVVGLWLFGELFRHGIVASGARVGARATFRAALVGATVARLLPVGGAITPVAMAWSVRRQAPGAGGAAVRSTVLGYGGLLVGTGLALAWAGGDGLPPGWEGWALAATIVMVAVGTGLMSGTAFMGRLGRRLPRWLRWRLGSTLVDLAPGVGAQALVWGRVGAEAVAMGLVMVAFGVSLDPAETVAAFGLSQLAAGIPGTPGGLGFAEAGLVGALALFGHDPRATVTAVLMYRLVSYWLPAVAGLVAGGTDFLRSGLRPRSLPR